METIHLGHCHARPHAGRPGGGAAQHPHGDGGPDRHMAELYHIACDPDERCNLINDPRCVGIAAQLRVELERLMKDVSITSDTMPLDEGVKQQLPDAKIR